MFFAFIVLKKEGVALLAEGVDRNWYDESWFREMPMSPSSRRAWIEILYKVEEVEIYFVALLAEGVDRNPFGEDGDVAHHVALLAEGVDRNLETLGEHTAVVRRPPRGGRG